MADEKHIEYRPMHPSEEKLITEMKRELGPDRVQSMNNAELGGSVIDDTGVMIMTMDAGDRAQAADMAATANEAVDRNPKIIFLFGVNGFEHDPREVDQIPEGRITLRALFENLSRKAFLRFDIEHQALMLVAMNVGERRGSSLHVPPEMVRDPRK